MTDKSESIYWANVWGILAADNLTFEQVMGNFRKNILSTDFEGEKLARIYLGKIISCTEKTFLMAYKKSYTVICQGNISNSRGLGKKILTPYKPPIPPPPQMSYGQPHWGWGWSRQIWHLSRCHLSTKWLACVHHVVAFKTFKTFKFCISRLKIRR